MRRLISTLLLASALLFTNVVAAQDFDSGGEAAMLERINAVRAENELAPLARSPELDGVARSHSTEMSQNGTLAHVSQTTGSPEDRVRSAGVPAQTIAENVALHQNSASAQEALLASPAHRQNMLNPSVTHVGIGSVRTAQGVYVTQVFAELPAAAEVAPPPIPQPTIEAPAEEPSIFQIIPPFVEQVATQAAEVAQPVLAPIAAPLTPDAAPAEVQAAPAEAAPVETAPLAPVDAAPVDAAPTQAAPTAPAAVPAADAPVANPDSAPSDSDVQVSPGAAATLRQLVGLAQALLRS